MLRHRQTLILLWLLVSVVLGFDVSFHDADYSRQICSGMWSGKSTYINVTFDPTSQGQLAMVVYEWGDAAYLGKVTSETDDTLPKTYVCTSKAVIAGFCTTAELGRFILDLPENTAINSTSFWSARVQLPSTTSEENSSSDFWDNPNGNPTPPASNDTSPWRRDSDNPSPTGIYVYQQPIQYTVHKTGYYCVAIVPVTVQSTPTERQTSDAHPSYNGNVFFHNAFEGKLPATDYPKVNFYFAMFIVYTLFAAAWGWLCYRHMSDLLPIQYYLSGLVGLLVIEMVANWGYYRYLNAHGKGATATVFLIVVAILDAGRNSMSFFMLLVVSLGLSVVRESLGRTMLKCQVLAGLHFIFGILYAVGIVELELESTSALILLIFVIPLAFTLSGFLLWIMYSLNATIVQLRARKQRYKLSMFEKLHRILLLSVLVIAIFFVVSSFSFSGRLAEDYAAKSWKVRWWLLDGWLALLYLVSFVAIAYLWPMSDEIAQDEEDAEDYDLEALEHRTHAREDDEVTLVGSRRDGHTDVVNEDNVVFEIGDEDGASDDEDGNKKRRPERLSGEHGGEEERRGLMSEGAH